jgi:hypothetical protein
MQPTFDYPSAVNNYLCEHAERIIASWRHWIGSHLIDPNLPMVKRAWQLFDSPFAVLSHDAATDPLLNYANRTALALFEFSWDELIRTPSRLTAETIHRDARDVLLAQVSQRGYIDDYQGVRISRTGRRFLIGQATVWNLIDGNGVPCGQAASFSTWKYLDSAESD